jgi:hypothetical protein
MKRRTLLQWGALAATGEAAAQPGPSNPRHSLLR